MSKGNIEMREIKPAPINKNFEEILRYNEPEHVVGKFPKKVNIECLGGLSYEHIEEGDLVYLSKKDGYGEQKNPYEVTWISPTHKRLNLQQLGAPYKKFINAATDRVGIALIEKKRTEVWLTSS